MKYDSKLSYFEGNEKAKFLIFRKGMGYRVARLRKQRSYTQTFVAASTGIPYGAYTTIEQGKLDSTFRGCDVLYLYKLAEFFNVSISYLLGDTDTRSMNTVIMDLQTLPPDIYANIVSTVSAIADEVRKNNALIVNIHSDDLVDEE